MLNKSTSASEVSQLVGRDFLCASLVLAGAGAIYFQAWYLAVIIMVVVAFLTAYIARRPSLHWLLPRAWVIVTIATAFMAIAALQYFAV